MQVLHVIPSVAPRYGGPSFAVVRYCRALNVRGVRACVATTNADGTAVLDVPVGEWTTFKGVETIFFGRRGEAFKYSPGLAQWLRRAVPQFDVVHVHAVFSHASIVAGRACRDAGVPYVVRPLGSLDPWSLSQHAWRKRVLLWSTVGPLLQRAAGIHFTTESERDLAAPITSGVPSAVIPLGIDDEFLEADTAPDEVRPALVVALARLHPKKNLDGLIAAFHQVATRPGLEAWRLVIAGSGDDAYLARLRDLAAAGPAASRIEIRGWVDGAAKIALLRSAAIFAVPSHQENFGLAALEALACGVPVVAAAGVNLSAAIESAGAGWIAPDAATPDGLARTLETAMGDAHERVARAARARPLAARYSWPATASALESWYASIAPAPVSAGETR